MPEKPTDPKRQNPDAWTIKIKKSREQVPWFFNLYIEIYSLNLTIPIVFSNQFSQGYLKYWLQEMNVDRQKLILLKNA